MWKDHKTKYCIEGIQKLKAVKKCSKYDIEEFHFGTLVLAFNCCCGDKVKCGTLSKLA